MKLNKQSKFSLRKLSCAAILSVLVILLFSACGDSSAQKNANQTNASPEVKLTAVERDIKSLQTANFDYIFVFRRKDGSIFDKEDMAYMKANSPADTNRFYLSDDDKAIVAGSSYEFKTENLKKLGERFDIENHSSVKPSENNSNQTNENTNSNKNNANK